MMARSSSASPTRSQQAMTALVVALALLAVLPSRWTAWVGWFGEITELLVNPVQHPVAAVMRSLRGPALPPAATDPAVGNLLAELSAYKVVIQQKESEIAALNRQLVELHAGASITPDVPVRQVFAPVIGAVGDLTSGVLKVKAGSKQGVDYNAVAVAQGVHLAGRVIDVSDRYAKVMPITDRAAGPIGCIVMLDRDDAVRGPAATLSPTGKGTLVGPIEWPPGAVGPAEITPGMAVRLDDGQWPRHAQGLIVGRVESVAPEASGRTIATVRPVVRFERVSELRLRMSGEAPGAAGAGGGAAGAAGEGGGR